MPAMRAHYARTQSWGAAPAGPLASGWGTPPPLDHPARQGVLRLPGPPGRRLRQHTMHAESQMKYSEILLLLLLLLLLYYYYHYYYYCNNYYGYYNYYYSYYSIAISIVNSLLFHCQVIAISLLFHCIPLLFHCCFIAFHCYFIDFISLLSCMMKAKLVMTSFGNIVSIANSSIRQILMQAAVPLYMADHGFVDC